MNIKPSFFTGSVKIAIGFALVVLIFFVVADWRKLTFTVRAADWHILILALMGTTVSFLAAALAFILIARACNIRTPVSVLFKVSLFTIALNNFFSLGGVLGYPVRIGLLKDNHAQTEDIIAASLLHSYLSVLCISAFAPFILGYLFLIAGLTHLEN